MNPIQKFRRSLARAEAKGLALANAMCLATARRQGKVSSRMMLLKGVSERGFIFYTNLNSRKARELKANPSASVCFWWPSLGEQVRIEGRVKPVSDHEADLYFASRPRESQIAAWASRQSKTLKSRKKLLEEFERLKKFYRGKRVPRPPFWSGFILVPRRIEFWHSRSHRLHDRILFRRRGKNWIHERLYP